jgi:hypothetical protein
MAISNFARGARYNLDLSAISTIPVGTTYDIPCSYVLIEMTDGRKNEYSGFDFVRINRSTSIDCYVSVLENHNTTYPSVITSGLLTVLIKSLTLFYDYNDNDYYKNAATSGAENIFSISRTQYAQVSIFNEYTNEWVDLPCASEYTGIATTVVNSGRNQDAVVVADVIASDIAKVEMKWNFLTLEQYSLIAQLFEPKYHGAFMNAVRFFDVVKGDFDGDNSIAPNTTTNRCRVMYCGDRKVSFAKMKLDINGKPVGYQGVSLNLIDTHKIYGE